MTGKARSPARPRGNQRGLLDLALAVTFAFASVAVPVAVGAVKAFTSVGGGVAFEAEYPTSRLGLWEETEGRNDTWPGFGISPGQAFEIHSPGHPLAAGLSGRQDLRSAVAIAWGCPPAAADVIATAGHDSRKAILFGFAAGAIMANGRPAPGPRTFAPIPHVDEPLLCELFAAAINHAAPRTTPDRALLLLTRHPSGNRVDQAIRTVLESRGWRFLHRTADEASREDFARASAVVISASVRRERRQDPAWMDGELSVPIVFVGNVGLAHHFGLVSALDAPPPGHNAVFLRPGYGRGHLRYTFHLPNPSEFDLWILGQSGGDPATALVEGDFGSGAADRPDARAFSLALPYRAGWTRLQRSGRAVTLDAPSPGWYSLRIHGGSDAGMESIPAPVERLYPSWRIDKVALLPSGSPAPVGDGPLESAAPLTLVLPGALEPSPEWLPTQTWIVRDGGAVIEAEAIDHHPDWMLRTEPTGFHGSGFLEWAGPDRTRSLNGNGADTDALHTAQGPREAFLIVSLHVDQPGPYLLNLRNIHRQKDGDNDVWAALLGHRASPDQPIFRMGDSHRDGTGFTWLDWGVRTFQLRAGLNHIYVAGRSRGFGIDQIAVYRAGDPEAVQRALNAIASRSASSLHGQPGAAWVPTLSLVVQGTDATAMTAKHPAGAKEVGRRQQEE